ncbi:hypothetical protein J3B02_000864 [Coemansia erecta]|nr:hypothetical protein J3B02_000864 [Coemansia erecta]
MGSAKKEKKDISKRKRREAVGENPIDDSSLKHADHGSSDNEEFSKRAKAQKQEVKTEAETKAEAAGSHEHDVSVAFKQPEDISLALGTINNDLLVQGFMHLREHIKICNREPSDAESKEQKELREQCQRVVYKWAEGADGFREIESAWERAYSFEVARLDSLIPNVITGLLKLFDAPAGMRYGNVLVHMVLDRFIKPVYRALNMSRSSACAAILQLLYQIVVYARGEHADRLLRIFDWTLKAIDDLPNMRSNVVGFSIRRLWIRFVLAFFSVEKCKTFNALFRVRFLISNLFNSVEKDSYQELHTLLNSVYENIILNSSVSKADKVRLLSIELMSNLAKATSSKALVDIKGVGIDKAALFIPAQFAEGAEEITVKDSMSALVIRFFRGMMTYPGFGICFPQYGLYPPPREMAVGASTTNSDEGDDKVNSDMFAVASVSKRPTSFSSMHDLCNAQILRILLHAINPAGSKRMGDLAIDILRVSPELIAPFWQNYTILLDPRLSPRYLGNTAFVLKAMSIDLPIPKSTEQDSRYSSPPRLSALIEHIYPLVLQRDIIGLGLQLRASPLVIYRNLLFIEMAMRKLDYAREWIRSEMHAAGGPKSASGAKWFQLDQKLAAVVKQRIPEAKIIITMQRVLQLSFDEKIKSADKSDEELNELQRRHAVLGGSLMRVVGGYQRHFNELFLEHNFELGKLITDIKLSEIIASDGNTRESHNSMNAHIVLHLLRAMETAPDSQTRWLSRAGGPKEHTYLGIALIIFLFAVLPEVRFSARAACLSALRSTGLFDHDTGLEAECWLDSMALLMSPQALRNVRIATASKASLDNAHSLVELFEYSIVLAAKQPNKYADRIHSALSADTLPFSPLLPAIVQSAVLKISAGSGPLAALMRESSSVRVLGEIRTNAAFNYVAEVACTISERCGEQAADALRKYMPKAAAMVLEPRAAKLDSDSDERKHYSVVENAFQQSLHGLLAYLGSLSGGSVASRMAVTTEDSVPAKISEKLTKAFDDACVDFENCLQQFIDKMICKVQEHGDELPAFSLTLWLLSLAKSHDSEKRQMAFIACIRWITLQQRVAADDTASVWDNDLFVELAPEILQIDDFSFLLALFRHLLISQRTSLFDEPVAQQLLTHILLASKGSLSFCSFGSLLIERLAQQGSEPGGVAFIFCLLSAHIDSLSAEMAEVALQAYSGHLVTMQKVSDMAEYNIALLAQRSSKVWLSKNKNAALRIWSPLIARIESEADKQLASSGHKLTHYLALVRIVEPCMDSNTRIAMSQILGAGVSKLEKDSAAIGLLPITVFDLLDGIASMPKDLQMLRSSMSNRIIRLWSETLLDGRRDRSLGQAALSVTRPEKQSNALRNRINAAREAITQPAEFDKAIDIAKVLEHFWNRSRRLPSAYAKDAESREILQRLLVCDRKLQKRACAWAESACIKKSSQQLMLAWLYHTLAQPYVEIGANGYISWMATCSLAKRIRKMCLLLGQKTSIEKELLSDSNILFSIKVFIQDSQDAMVVSKRFSSHALSSTIDAKCAVAEIIRTRALRKADSCTELLDVLVGVLELARNMVPSLDCVENADSEIFDTIDVLCDSAQNIAINAFPAGHIEESLLKSIEKCFDSIQAILSSSCLEMDITNAYWPASETQAIADCTPVSVFRLAAFATRAVSRIWEGRSPLQPWFALLRSVLRCRLFSYRIQEDNMRDCLALLIASLWDIASPSLSCWSASLDDFFTLDELEALTGAYSGTCTPSDVALLQVISLYEQVTRQSVGRAALAFGPVAAKIYIRERIGRAQYLLDRNENLVGEISEDVVVNALSCIDGSKMYKSLIEFPVYSLFESQNASEWLFERLTGLSPFTNSCEDNYDPRFILRWLWTIVSSPQPFDYRQIIETNAVGMAIVALSSAHLKTRKLAYYVLDAFYQQFSGPASLFRGRRQCLLLLDSLRNAITGRAETDFPLIPFTTTLFVATSLSVMLHPDHAVYVDLNRLLLKQPYLALGEVPMLRTALRTISNPRRQRVHIIRVIAQSARAIDLSWLWFFKSNSVNIVMTLAADPLGDVATSRSALMLLFNLTSSDNPQSLVRHVSKNRFSLLVWIRQQAMLETNSLIGAANQAKGEELTGNYRSLVQGAKAAMVNLTAFMRIALRSVANYPLVLLKEEGLQFKSFWVVMSSKQVNAPGQSSVLDLIQLIVEALATALNLLAGNLSASRVVTGPAITLLRSCVDTAYLLASMQRKASNDITMCMPQSARIAHSSLAILQSLEPYIDLGCVLTDGKAAANRMVVERDPCLVTSIAQAQSFDSLFSCSAFAVNGTRVCENEYAVLSYKSAVKCMVSWCFESPWKTCSSADYLEIVCRGLAVGDSRISKSLVSVLEEENLSE